MATFALAGEKFELVPTSKWTFAEARAFEKATNYTFVDLRLNAQVQKSAATEQAMLWISIKRVKPDQKFSDLDSLAHGDIEWEDDEDEDAAGDVDAEQPATEVPEVAPEDPTPGEDSSTSD